MSALAASVGGFLVFFTLLLIVAAVIVTNILQVRTRRNNLEAFARKFGGVVTSGWLSDTDLEMTVDGIPAHLSSHPGSKSSSAYTRLRFRHTIGGRLRIVPAGIWESLKKAFGSEDLTIGDPAFDAAFIVQGFPPAWVRRALDAPARGHVDRLAGLGGRLALEAGPAGILVALSRNVIGDLDVLQTFIAESIELFRALRIPSEDGVHLLSLEEIVGKGNWPVCEHPLGDAPRRCDTCATLHHADCWAYFGGCSTYACSARGGKL